MGAGKTNPFPCVPSTLQLVPGGPAQPCTLRATGARASQGLRLASANTEPGFTPPHVTSFFTGLNLSQTLTGKACKSRPTFLEFLKAMAVLGRRKFYHGKLNLKRTSWCLRVILCLLPVLTPESVSEASPHTQGDKGRFAGCF